MCTTISHHAVISGSGKNASGWFSFHQAHLSYDHPAHADLEHAVMVDFFGGSTGSPVRLGVEMSLDSARTLATALAQTIAQAETYEQALEVPERGAGQASS